MAPTALKRLTALQSARVGEMERMRAEFEEERIAPLSRTNIRSRIESLKEVWAEVRQTHADIVGRDGAETDSYMSENMFDRLRNAYRKLLDDLNNDLDRVESANPPAPPAPTNVGQVGPRLEDANLPKIDLPKFSGNYEDWESFADIFNNLVHSKPARDATKLSYLKMCLTGSAADLVKDVAITDANYLPTWRALAFRYLNPRFIVENTLDSLTNLPHLKGESFADLRWLADEGRRIVRSLGTLKMPVEHWDVWLVYILAGRLAPATREKWEAELSRRDRENPTDVEDNTPATPVGSKTMGRFATFSEFIRFLEERAQTISMSARKTAIAAGSADRKLASSSAAATSRPTHGSRRVLHAQKNFKTSTKCALCSGMHPLGRCSKLKAKTTYERRVEIKRLNLCFNCFGNHRSNECNSKGRCSTCGEKHHTLLHFNSRRTHDAPEVQSDLDIKPNLNTDAMPSTVNGLTASLSQAKQSVILATAQVTVRGLNGRQTRARALLDQGSEATFVTESLAQLLGLPKRPTRISLSGLGASSSGTAKFVTSFTLHSTVHPEFKLEMQALVLPRLTSHVPARDLIEIDFAQYAGLSLADPQFYIRDTIDIILGADVYGQLLRPGLRSFPTSRLTAQDTALGWVISGPIQTDASRRAERSPGVPVQALHNITTDDLNDSLQRFWHIEELPDVASKLKPEDEECERLFEETHTRDSKGYTVRLPVKANPPQVGAETRRMALGSLGHMYRRFHREPVVAQAYCEFMSTYEQLGHMTRVPAAEIPNPRAWYLPHHPVLQYVLEELRKIRVVFDASRLTRDKHSLNKFLMSGPPLQKDLALILLNWRRYRFVFTADIVKMFRQIRVALEDQDYQRILWAPSPDVPPVDYRLTTVTYGTACAPYLAIRTLLQLAKDEHSRFPLGSRCLENNTYVDDIFAGDDVLAVAIAKRTELTNILSSAGIELDKWASNHAELLPSRLKQSNAEKTIDRDTAVKTLGVHWNPGRDVFTFSTTDFKTLAGEITKRAVLSNIARLFDPLGWLSPITVTAKILMQDLWILKCDWDTPLPINVRDRWLEYCNSLATLSTLSIDRWLGSSPQQAYQIHGFADASSRAYAAAVYLRSDEGNGKFRISLLAAKTKVAPVKTISIPNLELCGAVLLVKLIRNLQRLDFLKHLPIHAWSDSQVVLNWLRKHPRFWKTFVANRVSYIQTELPSAKWAHVPTKQNSADLATRGCKPDELSNNSLWWHGPAWLSMSPDKWPQMPDSAQVLHAQVPAAEPEILTRYSSLTRLIRMVARCVRPLVHYRRRKSKLSALPDTLTTDELSKARITVLKLAQAAAFDKEISTLKSAKPLPKHNALCKLSPIIDRDGVLRVGGRLAHSELSHDPKNPPILPHSSNLSRLIVRQAHSACLHGGPTLTASYVSQKAWILGRKRLVKSVIHNCITCQRVSPRSACQLMGNLPAARVTPARPFSISGLDYAGPIQVRTTKGRGHKAYKGYIVLFICFATRAIHLELVSDCTSATFIAAYRRFVGRRGVCRNLYSDNATTFHGADKELKGMFNAASEFYKSTASLLANDGTSWNFIPPNTPHYGGLWEAGVKSTKHHLKRVIGEHTLTFEELSTVLVQIEACLNSRPLCPMNADVDDLHALTPAHFLIGETPGLVPDEEPPNVPENRLSRFQLLQRIHHNFWKRWSKEYLQHLQERGKWREPSENFAVGQLVLVMDDRYPPSKWPLGRVTEVHPGPDGLVRVATIKTATNVLRRHIARLCPLSTVDDSKPN